MMESPQILCSCSSCCPSRWNKAAIYLQRTEYYLFQKSMITACPLRNPSPLLHPGIQVFPGHQAEETTSISIESVPLKDMLKGLGSAHKDARYALCGQRRMYLIYSYLLDMNVNSFRRQFIASPDGKTKYCYFERVLLAAPQSHRYICKTADGSTTLFTLERSGPKELTVEITSTYDTRQTETADLDSVQKSSKLTIKVGGGTLRWIEECSRQVWRCGDIHEEALVIEPFMDRIVSIAISAILRDISNTGTLLKAAELAAPKPMTGTAGMVMKGTKHVLTSEPGTGRTMPLHAGMANQATRDNFRNQSQLCNDSDSGYGSKPSSRAASIAPHVANSSSRSRSESRGRRNIQMDRAQTAGTILHHIGKTYASQQSSGQATGLQGYHSDERRARTTGRSDLLHTAGSVLELGSEVYNLHQGRSRSVPSQAGRHNAGQQRQDMASAAHAAHAVFQHGLQIYQQKQPR